jgi:hypothetical protein
LRVHEAKAHRSCRCVFAFSTATSTAERRSSDCTAAHVDQAWPCRHG